MLLYIYLIILIFSWRTLFDLHLHKKRIYLVMSSPKCILYYPQVTDISKAFLSCFSISYTSLFWYKMHESSAYKSKLNSLFFYFSLSIYIYYISYCFYVDMYFLLRCIKVRSDWICISLCFMHILSVYQHMHQSVSVDFVDESGSP